MEEKHWLKNPWALTGMIYLVAIGIGIIVSVLGAIFNIDIRGSSFGVLIAAMTVGSLYANKFKDAMPKKLKMHVAGIYLGTQVLLLAAIVWMLEPGNFLFIGIVALLAPILALLVYLMLGFGSKMGLKGLEKKALKEKKQRFP